MVKINGYSLLDRLEVLRNRGRVLAGEFEKSLFVFEGETRRHPDVISAEYIQVEMCMAELLQLQDRYNSFIHVRPAGLGEMSLTQAIKLSGTFGACKTMWSKASDQTKKDRYSYRSTSDAPERDKDKLYAARVVPVPDALKNVEAAQLATIALRQAIRIGNGEDQEISEEQYNRLFVDA